MTQDELDALPIDGEWDYLEEQRDVLRVLIPRLRTVGALWQEPDDVMLMEDRQGRVWMTGWANGVRYKRRRPEYEAASQIEGIK